MQNEKNLLSTNVFNPSSEWQTLKHALCSCHDALEYTLASACSTSQDASESKQAGGTVLEGALESTELLAVQDLRRRTSELLSEAQRLTTEMGRLCHGDPVRRAQLERLDAQTAGYTVRARQACNRMTEVIERKKLLTNCFKDNNSIHMDEQGQLLREKSVIHASVTLLDQTLSEGREALASLGRQRSALKNFNVMVGRYTQRFPHIHSALMSIRHVRLKQSFILVCVVGSCLLLTLWRIAG